MNENKKINKTIKRVLILFLLPLLTNVNAKATDYTVTSITELNSAIASINATPGVDDAIIVSNDILTGVTAITTLTNPAIINAGGFTINGQDLGSLFNFTGA
ncbi:MAG TPA: hypothetical protein VMW66_00720, partial [Elusimicrobiales bacterium]|nr:hypothetical protein [Elusimicrobiales bacterium]